MAHFNLSCIKKHHLGQLSHFFSLYLIKKDVSIHLACLFIVVIFFILPHIHVSHQEYTTATQFNQASIISSRERGYLVPLQATKKTYVTGAIHGHQNGTKQVKSKTCCQKSPMIPNKKTPDARLPLHVMLSLSRRPKPTSQSDLPSQLPSDSIPKKDSLNKNIPQIR
jgi:hypothetical protein